MKTLLLALLFLPTLVFAQQAKEDYIIKHIRPLVVNTYTPDKSVEYVLVRSDFSENSIEEVKITGRKILRIDLVYTSYHEFEDFDQDKLNRKRLTSLFLNNPEIKKNNLIKWRLVEQRGCAGREECAGLFHGFVIYLEKNYTKEDMIAEMDSLNAGLLDMEETAEGLDTLKTYRQVFVTCKYPSSRYDSRTLVKKIKNKEICTAKYKGTIKVKYTVDARGIVSNVDILTSGYPDEAELEKYLKNISRWEKFLTEGKANPFVCYGEIKFPLNSKSISYTSYEYPEAVRKKYTDSSATRPCNCWTTDTSYLEIYKRLPSKVFSKAIIRNPTWKPQLIVVDVTGSMSPYTKEVLTWVMLKSLKDSCHFVFFNDGDTKPDQSKVIGNTGGLYHTYSMDYAEIKTTAIRAMYNGGGGDCPENNFEALLYGKEICPDCGDVMMVADNYAYPRDERLLKAYKGKLKIILCGTEYGINEKYLNLARKYHFTIHTMNSDLNELYKMKDGEMIKIDGITYKITKYGFVMLRST